MTGRFEAAKADLDEALQLDDKFYPARLNLGVVQLLEDRMDTNGLAMKSLTSMLNMREQQRLHVAAYYRGQIYWAKKNYEAATKDFSTVVNQKLNLPHVYLLRAIVRMEQQGNRLLEDQDGKAAVMEDLSQYLGLHDDKNADFKRARFLRRLATHPSSTEGLPVLELRLAEDQLDQAESRNPQSAEFLLEKGILLRTLGKNDQAIETLGKGIEMQGQPNLELYVERGWAKLGKSEREINEREKERILQDARTDFLEALQDQAGTPLQKLKRAEAHVGIGTIAARLRDSGDAELAAARAMTLLDQYGLDHYVQQYNLACIYGELSKTDDDRRTVHQQTAILFLRRALTIALHANSAQKVRLYLDQDTSFPAELRATPEFRELVEPNQM